MSRWLNVLVAVVSLGWAVLTTYTEIIEEDPNQYSIKSPEVRQQLENCSGTFAQRQACAERITDAREQLGFLVWCEKVAIILGPPLVLWGLLGYAFRQNNRAPEPAPAPRRVAAAAATPRPRSRVAAEDPAAREMPHQHDHAPGPAAADGPGEAPLFTGGRREPVRRRDH